ncbi:MazG-like family protein [Nonomuraea sp. NPDC049152]|uniref:MazG-like family protein n=1 Tax=Nonomuraea sp. NPDC049152 TaxID=3154350 RepID=UPI003409DAB0
MTTPPATIPTEPVPTATTAPEATGSSPTLWGHIALALTWLDAANPRTDHETAMRLMKVSEECGEAVAAYIGMTGQNPRKGFTHTLDDLSGELCDVAISALVALATLTGDAHTAETHLTAHLSRRYPRLVTLLENAHV